MFLVNEGDKGKESEVNSFFCLSTEEKQEWMRDIGDAIEAVKNKKKKRENKNGQSSSPLVKSTRQFRTITLHNEDAPGNIQGD